MSTYFFIFTRSSSFLTIGITIVCIGAIFGGAIGNQFGEGDGKDAMTLAGMFLGASLAHDDELAQGPGVLVTKCYIETRYEESVLNPPTFCCPSAL